MVCIVSCHYFTPFYYTQRFWFCEAENHIFQANFCVLFCHLATGRNKAICHAVDGILTNTLLTWSTRYALTECLIYLCSDSAFSLCQSKFRTVLFLYRFSFLVVNNALNASILNFGGK